MNKLLWQHFDVELQMRRYICGGTPKDPKSIEAWIRATVEDKNKLEQLIRQAKVDVGADGLSDEDLETLKQSCWNTFRANERGPFLEGRCCKAMLKESANIIRNIVNVANMKSKIAERVFVVEEEIYLGAITGSYEGFIHAWTPQGPISALKRVDYVERPIIKFTLKVLNEPLVSKDKKQLSPGTYLPILFEFGGENGLGSERSQGHGKYDLVKLERQAESVTARD